MMTIIIYDHTLIIDQYSTFSWETSWCSIALNIIAEQIFIRFQECNIISRCTRRCAMIAWMIVNFFDSDFSFEFVFFVGSVIIQISSDV